MEDEMYWEERRRYEEQEYFEWQRQGGRPGMGPPRPFPPGVGGPHMVCVIFMVWLDLVNMILH